MQLQDATDELNDIVRLMMERGFASPSVQIEFDSIEILVGWLYWDGSTESGAERITGKTADSLLANMRQWIMAQPTKREREVREALALSA